MKTLYTGLVCPRPDYIHTPLIEIVPVRDDTLLREAATRVADYDYLLFTSRYAVRHFFGAGGSGNSPKPRIVSIGPATTAALHDCGVSDIQQVDIDHSYGVIDWFRRQPIGSVLMPRSNLALDIIPDGLRQLGYTVTTVTAYENRMPDHPQRVDLSRIDRIVFTSPSTIDNFIRLYGALPEGIDFETRGPVTAEHLRRKIIK